MSSSSKSTLWIQNLLKDFKVENISKNEYFLKAGDRPNLIGYIQKGIFKIVDETEPRKKIKDFCVENDFLGSYGSILTGDPIHYNITAMEDSQVLVGNINKVLESHQDTMEYLKFSKYFLEYVYNQKEEKENDFMLMNIEEKVIRFREIYKNHLHRISKIEVATYFGITLSSLGRIERRLNIK